MPQPRSRQRAERARRRNSGSDLGARIAAAIPAIVFAIIIVAAGGLAWVAGLAALGIVCLHELFEMFDRAHPTRLGGFIGVIGLALAAHYGGREDLLLALMATVPLVFILIQLQPRGGAPGVSVTLLGLLWIGGALGHAVLLRDLPHGGGVVVAVLVGTFVGDTGAYLGGRAFGASPLAPRISPNKTWEGLGLGVIAAVAGVWFTGLYQDWMSGRDALLLGVGVALAAPIGDLFESYLKRDAHIKDTGRLFGAHGGALDRLDAVLFTVVVGYYLWLTLQ